MIHVCGDCVQHGHICKVNNSNMMYYADVCCLVNNSNKIWCADFCYV